MKSAYATRQLEKLLAIRLALLLTGRQSG